jgi:hypothetical protein
MVAGRDQKAKAWIKITIGAADGAFIYGLKVGGCSHLYELYGCASNRTVKNLKSDG